MTTNSIETHDVVVVNPEDSELTAVVVDGTIFDLSGDPTKEKCINILEAMGLGFIAELMEDDQ